MKSGSLNFQMLAKNVNIKVDDWNFMTRDAI